MPWRASTHTTRTTGCVENCRAALDCPIDLATDRCGHHVATNLFQCLDAANENENEPLVQELADEKNRLNGHIMARQEKKMWLEHFVWGEYERQGRVTESKRPQPADDGKSKTTGNIHVHQ